MTVQNLTRRLAVLGGALTLALTLVAGTSPQWAQAHHAGPQPGPVNAQSTFKWGTPQWQDEFEYAERKPFWRATGHGNVRPQFGMLTLNTGRRGDTSAILQRPGHATGRWEIRLRSHRYSTHAADYTVRTELIPAGKRPLHCGNRNVALEQYRLGHGRANFYIRNRPARQYVAHQRLDLRNDQWHTFGVEVTHRRISWFVDAHVIRSERRPKAISGVPFTVRLNMEARPGARMNKSRMQIDWLRYFDLHRPNQKSVKAPGAHRTPYAAAC